jgi:hypothetical protein
MNTEPSIKEMAALWNKCLEFVESQRISYAETIYQSDRVIENAYEFIEDVCDIVGYNDEDEE